MTCGESQFSSVSGMRSEAQNDVSAAKSHIWRRDTEAGMVVACHLGRCLEMKCGRQWFKWLGGFLARRHWNFGNKTPKSR